MVQLGICVYISVAFNMALPVARVDCRVVLSVTERNVQRYKEKWIILKYNHFR